MYKRQILEFASTLHLFDNVYDSMYILWLINSNLVNETYDSLKQVLCKAVQYYKECLGVNLLHIFI